VTWFHGWHSIATCYGLTAAGLLFGFIKNHSHPKHILLVPLSAAVFSIITALFLGLVSLLPIHLGQTLGVILSLPCFVYVGAFAGEAIALGDHPSLNHKRGTILTKPSQSLARNPVNRNTLTLAGFPVNPSDETKHFKLLGTTGTGKSTAIRELLRGALERGDRAVIADPDGGYIQRFYDPARGDLILNPFEPKAARWDLFAEMQTHYDADQLAVSLIPDTEGTERPWRGYARVLLISLLRQLHRVQHHDVAELYRLLTTTPADDLRDLLSDTPAGPYLAQDNGRFFAAVRAVANTHLSALEHIARQTSCDTLSVRSWIRARQGRAGVLYLPYKANEIAALRSLISTWMRLAIFEALCQGEGDQKLWFIIDELDALGPIEGLKDALARLRKFGGRCVLGFQSIAQVSGTYGHAEAQTIVENCGNTLILRCSSSENGGTARFASRLIGEREVIREQTTKSRGGGPIFASDHRSVSTSLQYVTESAVLASEIEQLPDLQGYLKFTSQPEWKRIKLTLST
jgi:type IV secretory pathway TraG/TraD family ATPase VirD4